MSRSSLAASTSSSTLLPEVRVLKFLLLTLVVGAVVADVAAKRVAENRIETQLASSIDGVDEVDAEIESFPFIPAVLNGHFDGLRLSIPRVASRGLRVSQLELNLRGVEFSALDVFAGSGEVRVAGGEGTAQVTDRAITRALRAKAIDVRVSFEGSDAVIEAAGRTQTVDDVELADGAVRFVLPTGPVSLDLPETLESVSYESAHVENGHLRLDLVLEGKRLEL